MKYPGTPSYSDDPGKIYTLNLLDSELKLEALSIKGQFDKDSFNPHGISVFTDDKGLAFSLNEYIHKQEKLHSMLNSVYACIYIV